MDSIYKYKLIGYQENDGKLTPFENKVNVPFEVKRIFFIHEVPFGEERANHACMNGSMVLVAVNGAVKVKLDTGTSTCDFELREINEALFIPSKVWISVEFEDQEGIMMVLSDIQYKDAVYQSDYYEFKKEIGG